MAYKVFDNGMPADTSPQGTCCNMSKGIGLDNSKFDTLEDAIDYVLAYLGKYAADLHKVNRMALGIMFMNGYAYSGSGDKIQIREVQS